MVFDPKLEGGVAFNQPVQQPSAMSAIADLFSFGVKTLQQEAGNAPKLTEDEKFSIAVREFEGDKGATFSWDRKGMREFIFKYPQFTTQAKTFGENLGVMVENPIEKSRDAVLDWAGTPEGIMASARASGMTEEDGTAYLSEQFSKQKAQEAKIAELERNTQQLEAEGTLITKQWDALKPVSKDTVDNVVSVALGPILQDVMNGVSVDVTPELKASLGLRYDTIDMNNLPAVLADTKIFLERQVRSNYMNNFGSDSLPTEDFNKTVFSSIDALIEVGKAMDTPQERASAMEALIQTRVYEKLDAAGLATTIEILKTLPPDTAGRIIGEISLDGPISKVLAPTEGDRIFTSAEIVSAVGDLSRGDAESVAADTLKIIEKGGMTPEFFTAFKESAKRSGYNVVDGPSFKALIKENITEINSLAKQSPDFRIEFSDFLMSDVQQTISTVKRNLVAGVDIKFDGKQFVFVPQPGTLADQKWNDSYRPYSEFVKTQLPEGMNLDVLNEKVSSLKLLGEMGGEVSEAILMQFGPVESEGKKKPVEESALQPAGLTITKSSSGGEGGDIGTSLGIDFASMETEAGLPSGYLNKVAMIESRGNPNAQNPNSSAGGLFQQIDSNARAYGVSNKFDPMQSTEGAVRFAVENKRYLTRTLGREPTGGELYLAHQQGPGGAAALLANPTSLAADIVGLDAVRLNGGSAKMTAGEFANIWISKYNGSRGQTSYSASEATPTLSVDSSAREVPESTTASVAPSTGLETGAVSFDSPEVQQLIEQASSNPEEAVKVAKELLAGKPVDPQIKALIEALVKIGER